MPLAVEDIPGLFLRKAERLRGLLVTNEYADLEALSERGVDILAAANIAPNRMSAGADTCSNECSGAGTCWPYCPGTERAFREANIQRHAFTAVARALQAGAFDAVEWALGAFTFRLYCWRLCGPEDPPPIWYVLDFDGFRFARDLPCSAYIELVRRGLLDDKSKHWNWSLVKVFWDKLRFSAEKAHTIHAAMIECLGDPLAINNHIIQQDELDSYFAMYCATRPEPTPEDFVREMATRAFSCCAWQLVRPWAARFVDEYEYCQIVWGVLESRPEMDKLAAVPRVRTWLREKLCRPPKNAADC